MFSPGTTFKTSGDPEISEEKEIHSELARKNLKGFGKTKVFEIHRSSEKVFLTVGKVQRKGLSSSGTSKKVGSEAGNKSNTVDNLFANKHYFLFLT